MAGETSLMDRTPLYMLPNGTFVRTADSVPEGSVIVEEPPVPEEPKVKVEDRTEAYFVSFSLETYVMILKMYQELLRPLRLWKKLQNCLLLVRGKTVSTLIKW